MKRFIFLFLLFIFPVAVSAHPGSLADDGCHYCRTNCSSWGLVENERHCHSGDTYTNSNGQVYSSDGTLIQDVVIPDEPLVEDPVIDELEDEYVPPKVTVTKSDDTGLKSVIVDDVSVNLDDLVFITSKDEVNIKVDTSSVKATYKVVMNELVMGKNNISIIVTAENGNSKTYNLEIIKNETINNSIDFVLEVDGVLVDFVNYEAGINVLSSVDKLEYDYELSDNALLEVRNASDLKNGKNIVEFVVTNVDGYEQIYTLLVTKSSLGFEIFSVIFVLSIFGGFGYLIYRIIKRVKKSI